jgi:hypothetical protein
MVKQEMNEMLRKGVLPFVHRRSSFVVVVVARSAMLMSVEKIKVIKKQRRSKRIGLTKKILVAGRGLKF